LLRGGDPVHDGDVVLVRGEVAGPNSVLGVLDRKQHHCRSGAVDAAEDDGLLVGAEHRIGDAEVGGLVECADVEDVAVTLVPDLGDVDAIAVVGQEVRTVQVLERVGHDVAVGGVCGVRSGRADVTGCTELHAGAVPHEAVRPARSDDQTEVSSDLGLAAVPGQIDPVVVGERAGQRVAGSVRTFDGDGAQLVGVRGVAVVLVEHPTVVVETARGVELLLARQLAERRLTRLGAAVDGADVLLVVAPELDADELGEGLVVGRSFLLADDGAAVTVGERAVRRRVDGEEPALDGLTGLAVQPVYSTDGALFVARGDHDV